jgi:16S rRNA (uracil1498-N3)-methyltransferase
VTDVAGPDPAVPFAFVADLDAPVLSADEQHHLERVRRLRPGAPLTVGDGVGRFRAVAFGPELAVLGPIAVVPPPVPSITIGFALTKADKPEMVVQKLTELAVDRIVPFVAERSITRWDDAKAARNVARWRVIAREAAAQAHRPHLPDISEVRPFVEVVAGACLAHYDGDLLDATVSTVLVGPEGGWSPTELARGERRVRLGPHVLRAETAALAAATLAVAHRRG